MKKKAFITGINGQDGSWLAELLLQRDYDVYGLIRRNSIVDNETARILPNVYDNIKVFYGDLSDYSTLARCLSEIQPDEIYNVAAQSQVRVSFQTPLYTLQTNTIGVANILEAYRQICPSAKFLQASSSEMFGNNFDDDRFQRETTPMHPVSPYGISKLASYHLVRHYRRAYKLFACNSICFNHTGPRRGDFTENRIIRMAVQIKLGLEQNLILGNLDCQRDFGDSRDYVNAMTMIINHDHSDDFVIATGDTHSMRDICEYVFAKLDLNYIDYVIQDPKRFRPEELGYLRGDSTKIRDSLGWEPTINFNTTLDEMIEHWMAIYKMKEK